MLTLLYFISKIQLSNKCANSMTKFCSCHSLFYPFPCVSGAITDPSKISTHWRVFASLFHGNRRRVVLDRTISIAILACTNSHISEYSWFNLKLRWNAILWVSARASAPGIQLDDNTKVVKWWLYIMQAWGYLSFFFLFAFVSAFTGNMQR